MIDQDTLFFGSFAEIAGSTGCKFFNAAFERHGINAIYKSFSVSNILAALTAMKTLNMKGAGITMPYKRDVLNYVDSMSEDVSRIGAANTIINTDGKLHAENTDWLSVRDLLEKKGTKVLTILGDGGYSEAVQYACAKLDIETSIINRSNWGLIKEVKYQTVFNCTPVINIKVDESVDFIDCLTWSPTGKDLAHAQGKYQFKLYTGMEYNDN